MDVYKNDFVCGVKQFLIREQEILDRIIMIFYVR
jgi:hypothetical protein